MLFQLTILQIFSFEDAKDADNSLLEARGKDISIFLIFFLSIINFLRCAVVGFSLLFSTYVVFPLIYLLNILQFVLVVDTAADADFCDKSTIFVYINFLRCPILFSFISFLFIFSLKHNNQSVLIVDITAGAVECFLYLLRHNNRFVVMVDITPGSEMQVYSYLHFFVNLVNMYHILFSW